MFRSIRHSTASNPDFRVVGVFSDRDVSAKEDPMIETAATRKEFAGELSAISETTQSDGQRAVLVGLGPFEKFGQSEARTAAAAVGRRLSLLRATSAQITLDRAETDIIGRAFGETLGLLAYRFADFRGKANKPDQTQELTIWSDVEELDEGLGSGLRLAEAANLTRRLAETPPNVATPQYMADAASKVALDCGLDIRVITGQELEEERLTGLITVGKASENPPCLIRLEYAPPGTEDLPPTVVLGKTITYDTGGLSIKPKEGMAGMKIDKAGGCAVLGVMQAIATVIKPRARVVGLLVAAENSISNNAYRPDDIMTYRNGITIEVTNTDAEGRLVLADGLIWASEVEKAHRIIDMATLTGGVVIALGSTFAGLFGNDDELVQELISAGQTTGERLWQLPLDDDYREMMRSQIADFVNSVPNRKAHPVQGATFLHQFVPDKISWAHIDIAGTAKTDKDKGAYVPGATGFGVRLLAQYFANRHGS
ncbi:MAG: leucyl aminopeptidase family protein [Fimbriimonadaceae bacterium]|nr:leucyl aminopeptidase family protein [Fimbriimonadaceae bacterium]